MSGIAQKKKNKKRRKIKNDLEIKICIEYANFLNLLDEKQRLL